MACGLKKQNTNEGGVHLTERTCSPYNPIIKQIVDDCLGLPIYPVTSIDAVIDEDGNTLRTLFEDLVVNVNEGSSDIENKITNILNEITQLGDTYIDNTELTEILSNYKTEVAAKLELLYKISSMNTATTENGQLVYSSTTQGKPYIVEVIEELLSIVNDITGDENGGDGTSLKSLKKLINDLRDLVLAIANYDEGTHAEDGVTHTDGNTTLLQIVYEIAKLKAQLGPGSGNESLPSQIESLRGALDALTAMVYGIAKCAADSTTLDGIYSDENDHITHIVDLVNDINSYIDPENQGNNSLYLFIVNKIIEITGGEVDLSGYAHLDLYVLDQKPEETDNPHYYKVLKYSEYPPTSAIFLNGGDASELNYTNKCLYFGFLEPVLTNATPNFYPFGHAQEEVGWPLYEKYENSQGGFSYRRVQGVTSNGTQVNLRAGDSTISSDEIPLLIDIILGKTPLYVCTPTNIVSNKYENLYIDTVGHGNASDMVLVGDINNDGEANIGDVGSVIKILVNNNSNNFNLNSPLITLPGPNPPSDIMTGTIMFMGLHEAILYPCIDGKLYTDINTGNIYRYDRSAKGTKMVPVSKIGIEEGSGISISLKKAYTTYDVDEDISEGPFYNYQISIEDTVCKYVKQIPSNSQLNSILEDFILYEGDYLIVPVLNLVPKGDQSIDYPTITINNGTSSNGTLTLKYNITNVTNLIDVLLTGNTFTTISTALHAKKLALLSYIEDKLNTTLTSTQENQLNQIKTYINNLGTSSSFNTINQNEYTVYYVVNGELRKVTARGYYAYLAFAANWDFGLDGAANINDVTSLIDSLLLTNGTITYALNPSNTQFPYLKSVTLDSKIYKKVIVNGAQQLCEVVPEDYEGSGDIYRMDVSLKLFRVVHDSVGPRDYDWYYFDDANVVRPLIPNPQLIYEGDSKRLDLYINGVAVSSTPLGGASINSSGITSSGSLLTIRNLGQNSTPYLFGTLDPTVDPTTLPFLDENQNFIIPEDGLTFSMDDADFFNLIYASDINIPGIYDQGGQATALTSSAPTWDIMRNLYDYSLIGGSEYKTNKFDLAEKIKSRLAKALAAYEAIWPLETLQSQQAVIAAVAAAAAEDTIIDPTEDLERLVNTPEGGIDTEYYCLDYKFGAGAKGGDAYDCKLYKVREHIEITLDTEAYSTYLSALWSGNSNFEDYLACFHIDASLTLIERSDIQTNVIYYFPKFGLQLRFERHNGVDVNLIKSSITDPNSEPDPRSIQSGLPGVSSIYYTPIVVQVEKKDATSEFLERFWYNEFFELYLDADSNHEILLYPNEYLTLNNLPLSGLKLDFSRILHTPGHEVVDISGKFIANLSDMPILFIDVLTLSDMINLPDITPPNRSINANEPTFAVLLAKWVPVITTDHEYEYHIYDGIFSYIDVTSFLYNSGGASESPDGKSLGR